MPLPFSSRESGHPREYLGPKLKTFGRNACGANFKGLALTGSYDRKTIRKAAWLCPREHPAAGRGKAEAGGWGHTEKAGGQLQCRTGDDSEAGVSKIRTIDLMLVDEVFASDKGPGYVLNFTDRTFSEFFRDELRINIDDQKYRLNGTSKGKRFRTFLQLESDVIAGKALRVLWEYREAIDGYSKTSNDVLKNQEERFFTLVHKLDGRGLPKTVQQSTAQKSSVLSTQELMALEGQYTALMGMTDHRSRGFAFERYLSDLFAAYGLAPRSSFRLRGEQIDGSFELPPETFLVEAKWQSEQIGQSDLLAFAGKVEGKAQWTRGMFISYSGFTQDGLFAFARGRPTSIVCMDGFDLYQVISGKLDLTEVIRRKKRRAAETGNAFASVRDLFTTGL